jgi:hypothetical protein
MHEVKEILKSLTIKLDAPAFKARSGDESIMIPFWSLYSQEEMLDITTMSALYEMNGLP